MTLITSQTFCVKYATPTFYISTKAIPRVRHHQDLDYLSLAVPAYQLFVLPHPSIVKIPLSK